MQEENKNFSKNFLRPGEDRVKWSALPLQQCAPGRHQIRHGLQLDIHLQNVLPELGWHGVKLCTDSGIDIGHGNHLADSMDRGTEIHTMKGNKNALRNRSAGVFGLSPTERRLPPCGGTVVLGV